MPISAPINTAIDLQLPIAPELVADKQVYDELVLIYKALRTLHASITPQYTTANRPAYKKGVLIYDTTLGKLVIGGATAWEVVTSV